MRWRAVPFNRVFVSAARHKNSHSFGVPGIQVVLFLKILTLLIAAAGGAIALFGEGRSGGKLTRLGKLSLLLIVVGVAAGTLVEIVTSWEQSLDRTWELTTRQPIYEIKVSFDYNKPMRVTEFADLLERFRFVFGTYAALESDGPLVRYLEFEVDRSVASDVEGAILLRTRTQKHEVLARSRAGNLKYRTGPRNYVSSIYKKWNSWDLETVGIDISIPFYKLGLAESVRTVGDLPKLNSLTVHVPADLTPRNVDGLSLVLVTADIRLLRLNVMSLGLEEMETFGTDTHVANVSGADILKAAKDQFTKQMGRSSIGPTIFR
jgi:hypothetical protein